MTRIEIAWKILMLKCSEASRLSSESLDHPIPFHDRLAIRLHSLVCPSCRRFARQILMIRQASTDLREPVSHPGLALPDEIREQIKKSLQDD